MNDAALVEIANLNFQRSKSWLHRKDETTFHRLRRKHGDTWCAHGHSKNTSDTHGPSQGPRRKASCSTASVWLMGNHLRQQKPTALHPDGYPKWCPQTSLEPPYK